MEKGLKKLLVKGIQDRKLTGNSKLWANWQSQLSLTTCLECVRNHGKIVKLFSVLENYFVNAHKRCKCIYVPMRTKKAGTVTKLGDVGADVYLVYLGKLPNNYITKDVAKNMDGEILKGI